MIEPKLKCYSRNFLRVETFFIGSIFLFCGISCTYYNNYTFHVISLIDMSDIVSQYIAPAPYVALSEIQNRGLLQNNNSIYFEFIDSPCDIRIAAELLTNKMKNGRPTAIICGVCNEVCNFVAILSDAWNMMTVSYLCNASSLSGFSTFIRTVSVVTSLGTTYNNFRKMYNWTNVAVISSANSDMSTAAGNIAAALRADEKPATVTFYTLNSLFDVSNGAFLPDSLLTTQHILKNILPTARIVIVIADPLEFSYIMYYAQQLGLVDGLHVFITFDFPLWAIQMPPDLYLSPHEATVKGADYQSAFQGVVSANAIVPSGAAWKRFQDSVFNGYNLSSFPSSNYSKPPGNYKIPVDAGYYHDALLLIAYAINRTIADNDDKVDFSTTANITKFLVQGQSFEGVSGTVLISDDNGNREPYYSIQIINNGTYISMYDTAVTGLVPAATLNRIQWQLYMASPPPDAPPCGWKNEFCQPPIVAITTGVIVPIVIIILLVVIIWQVRKQRKAMKEMYAIDQWRVAFIDITKVEAKTMGKSLASLASAGDNQRAQIFADVAMVMNKMVVVKNVNVPKVDITEKKVLLDVYKVRLCSHENINSLVGACVDSGHVCILMTYAQKGSLQDVLNNDEINLSNDFRISISMDIASGMEYLVKSSIKSHGHLTSTNCVIDSRWTCKITDYGFAVFRQKDRLWKERLEDPQTMVWTAPELLRLGDKIPLDGTPEADVYSFGIILQEIMLRDFPFALNEPAVESSDIVAQVAAYHKVPFRPNVPRECVEQKWIDLMSSCWDELPEKRPTFTQIKSQIKDINGGKKINMMDTMLKMLEQHAEKLEEIVEARTKELNEEEKRVENLLYSILPKSVTGALKAGKSFDPETFDHVTIYFSDIVGFTAIAFKSTPMQVVALLNKLYIMFDDTAGKYDVYKVETIGDAYMVVSGLPERNGDAHAGQVVTFALHLLSGVNSFIIPHLPDTKLRVRIGIHTGSVVAGVVGLKMPRYCLFGETVSIASKMESGGMPLRVHVSDETVKILKQQGDTYKLVPRGEMPLKGGSHIMTWWSIGIEGFTHPLPDMSIPEGPMAGHQGDGH